MKTLNHRPVLKQIVLWLGSGAFCVLWFWFGLQFPALGPATAQALTTPTPTCTVTATPSATAAIVPRPTACPDPTPSPYSSPAHSLPSDYQALNQSNLIWIQFPIGPAGAPTPTPGPAKPAVIVIHGGSWFSGDPLDIQGVCNDIAAAGYFTVSVNYELAPNGYVPGQPCHTDDGQTLGWRLTEQVKDIEAQIGAMLEDPRCNGKVGLVGGSAGGTLALLAAFDTHTDTNTWPHWAPTKRPICVAVLSAPTNFGDLTPPTGEDYADQQFVIGTQNVGQPSINSDGTANLDDLKSISPVAKVPDPSTYAPVPLYMVNSWFDHPPPYQQMIDMICALKAKSITNFQTLTIPGDDHSFHYWNSWDHTSSDQTRTVAKDVIAYLDSYLK